MITTNSNDLESLGKKKSPSLLECSSNHSLLIYSLTALLSLIVYFYGLGSDHLATNGDELLYAQIARATAQSGHWLPLQSPIARLENTKPPLLFWQGILSTSGTKDWTLFNLRWPSVLYTLLIAFLLGVSGMKITHRRETGLLAALLFLSFFGIFRYGRCFLTSAPEIFWLSLPCFFFLLWPERRSSSWRVFLSLGILLGIGLLYKSFTLVAPPLLTLCWWFLQEQSNHFSKTTIISLSKIALLGGSALVVFSLWFVLDPHPQSIFKHFVLKENLGKFDAGESHYLINFFFGNSSIWRNVIAYPLNAGLLAPALVTLFFLGWRERSSWREQERELWIWVIAIFLVFSLPNQRDERYLLLGMPALALLLAFSWEKIPRWVFMLSLLAVIIIAMGLGGLALLLEHYLANPSWSNYHYPLSYWIILTITIVCGFLGLLEPSWTRLSVLPAIMLLYLCYACFLWPFDGPLGHFDEAAKKLATQKRLWVPVNFNAREESYRFLLPGAQTLIPYDYQANLTIEQMQKRVPRFIISLPLEDCSGENLQHGTLLGRRLNLIDRFNAQETKAMMLGNIAPYLFHQDLLIEEGTSSPSLPDLKSHR